MLGRFEVVRRLRPVDLVAPTSVALDLEQPRPGQAHRLPRPAAYVGVVAELAGPAGPVGLWLAADAVRLSVSLDPGRGTGLEVSIEGRRTLHASRRHGRPAAPPDALALSLTGSWLAVLTRTAGAWTVRGRVDLDDPDHPDRVVPVHDEAWLAGLEVGVEAAGDGAAGVTRLVAGGFGQLGLRDLRFVTEPDGTPVHDGADLLLSATSAGPGFFPTAHTSLWRLQPDTLDLRHGADLYFRRRGPAGTSGVFGDHATHVLRDPDRPGGWLVATSTWGDFARERAGARVEVTLAHTDADLTRGSHVLDARPLPLPTTGLRSTGVWDPHLVHDRDGWRVGYVSAPRFFSFHPVLATGPTLADLTLAAAAPERRATEGTTLLRIDGDWRVLASDGRDGRRGQRAAYPVFDEQLTQLGVLDADYGTNLPWPSLARHGDGWLMVGFDATPYGGPLPGYGTHGDVVVARSTGDALPSVP